MVWTLKLKSLLPSLLRQAQDGEHVEPFAKGRNDPSFPKRGRRRFSEQYVFSIMDSLVIQTHLIKSHRLHPNP